MMISFCDPYMYHPDGLSCPMCGSDYICYWPDLEDWNKLSGKRRKKLTTCAVCFYNETRIEEEKSIEEILEIDDDDLADILNLSDRLNKLGF
jgi:hypothetical protein